MKIVALLGEARDEMIAAAEWYEAQRSRLGSDFILAIDEVLGRVVDAPTTYPRWQRDPRFRKAQLTRFPYVIFFREIEDRVIVVAVAHARRKPGYWLLRRERR